MAMFTVIKYFGIGGRKETDKWFKIAELSFNTDNI